MLIIIAYIDVKADDYRRIIYGVRICGVIYLLENPVLFLNQNRRSRNSTFFNWLKNYRDLVIYFTRYDPGKKLRTSRLYYHELLGMNEEYEGKNIWWLMIIC